MKKRRARNPWVRFGNSPGGNYESKLGRYIRGAQTRGEIKEAGVFHVDVLHDNWCGIFSGRSCNCSPQVRKGKDQITPELN
jgi:hypothetical protein